jgi:flagellar protein FlbD
MILLARPNGHPILLNADLIETVEEASDTVITLVNGNKVIVRDSLESVRQRVIEFRRAISMPG